MQELKIFNYNDSSIEFEVINGQVFANATAMCQAFNKDINQWKRLPSTQRYNDALCKNHIMDLFIVKQGGSNQGTWIHEKLILKLAQWLDVDFEIWCDDKMAELLKTGKVELKPQSQLEILANAVLLASNLITDKDNQIKQLTPKAEYTDKVLESKSELSTTLIAKELGMSAQSLNKILNQKGVQYKQGETWVLFAKYQNKGYTETHTTPYYDSKGQPQTSHSMVWTERGRAFIQMLLNNSLSFSIQNKQFAYTTIE